MGNRFFPPGWTDDIPSSACTPPLPLLLHFVSLWPDSPPLKGEDRPNGQTKQQLKKKMLPTKRITPRTERPLGDTHFDPINQRTRGPRATGAGSSWIERSLTDRRDVCSVDVPRRQRRWRLCCRRRRRQRGDERAIDGHRSIEMSSTRVSGGPQKPNDNNDVGQWHGVPGSLGPGFVGNGPQSVGADLPKFSAGCHPLLLLLLLLSDRAKRLHLAKGKFPATPENQIFADRPPARLSGRLPVAVDPV